MRSWSGWPPSSSRPSWRAAFTPGRCSASSAPPSPPQRSAASMPSRSTARSRNASTSPRAISKAGAAAVVDRLATEDPSPAFPSRGIDIPPKPGSTQYFTAYGAVARGYPLLRGGEPGPGDSDPPEVLDLMQRVTLIPTIRRTLFGPRITIFTKDGRSFTKEGTGREFIWDFEEEARRIRDIAPGIAIGDKQFAALIPPCRHLDPP